MSQNARIQVLYIMPCAARVGVCSRFQRPVIDLPIVIILLIKEAVSVVRVFEFPYLKATGGHAPLAGKINVFAYFHFI